MELKNEINYGLVHTHSEFSVKDSAQKLENLIARAKELNAQTIVLTDHGVLTGAIDFMKICKENGVKGIPGVEAYVEEDNDDILKRCHLILIPKNITGFMAISKAVSKSYSRLIKGFPCMNIEILKECFGEGTPGHNNVYATSACVGGVLAKVVLQNEFIEKEIEKIDKKIKTLNNPNDPSFIELKKNLDIIDRQIPDLRNERDKFAKISKKSLIGKRKTLNSLDEGTEEYNSAKSILEKAEEEIAEATKNCSKIKEDIGKLTKQRKSINDIIKELSKTHEKFIIQNSKKEHLQNLLKSENDIKTETKNKAIEYVDIFGKNNFYIEIQYHGLDIEEYAYPRLIDLSNNLDLPIIVTNDVHFTNDCFADRRARQINRSLRFNQWEEETPDSGEYYIKSDIELYNIINQIIPSEYIYKGFLGLKEICDNCNVEFTDETHYPKFINNISDESAEHHLKRLSYEGIKKRYPNEKDWTPLHQQRLDHELNIIISMGFADYLSIVEDYLREGRRLGNSGPDKIGYTIGPGRGSAAGSLVCYLCGITSIDPIKYGLLFERFLNPERVSMPDIDSDFANEIREETIRYVKRKYGENAVCSISTRLTQAAKAAIRNVARLLGDAKYNDSQSLYSLGSSICKAISFNDTNLKSIANDLKQTFASNKDALEIIENALLVEGTITGYSTHAAGIIISDNNDVSDYVPLMYNEKKEQWACQCDMVQAEESYKLLKMDFLGLRNLDIISGAIRAIKQNTGICLDMENLPMNDEKIFRSIFANGNTNGIFQFESGGMKQMLKQFKPSCFEDLILLVAAYRPGPLQYIPSITAVKHGKESPKYIVPQMKDILASTYGKPVYQEQIMQIFNKIAGFSLGESDIIRRYMSKKKTDKFMKYKDKFIDGLQNSGATKQDAEIFWDELLNFSQYAFNKSHAAAYAMISYQTAYLKYYYPVEYMSSLMTLTKLEKLPPLIAECKEMGINIISPNINLSKNSFLGQGNDIIFGFELIKGVGSAGKDIIEEIETNGPMTSFKDTVQRLNFLRNDAFKTLIDCGVFDEFNSNRKAINEAYSSMSTIYEKIFKKQEKLKELEILQEEAAKKNDDKALKKIDTSIKKAKEVLTAYQEQFDLSFIPDDIIENKREKLKTEKNLLGVYISGHPLDEYTRNINAINHTKISDLTASNSKTICGIITDLKIVKRKKDGKNMAFFKLSDTSGSIDVACFTDSYAKYNKIIEEEAVIKIQGNCSEKENDLITNNDDEINIELQFIVKKIDIIQPVKSQLIIAVPNVISWIESIYNQVLAFKDTCGHELFIYDKSLSEIRQTKLYVSDKIFSLPLEIQPYSV